MANAFEQAKRRARAVSIIDVARRHGALSKLKKIGDEYVGPCPHCRGVDRFAINPHKRLFVCRGCQQGGDAIDLERFLNGTKFWDAVKDLSGETIVEEDPGEAARRARKWAFRRGAVEEIVYGLRPVLGSPGEPYLRDERAIDTSLPAIRQALETTVAIGWRSSVYFSQDDPKEPFHELHGQRLGCIVGIMTDPATGERLGPISRTYIHCGKKIGKAKTLKRAEAERLGVVRLQPATDQLCVGEGIETCLAAIELGYGPVWSTGSASVMRDISLVDGVERLTALADNDGPGEKAARALIKRWLSVGCSARLVMPEGDVKDLNDELRRRKGRAP
jgi:hypothetical protein